MVPCGCLKFPDRSFSVRMKIPMILSAVLLIITGFIHIGLGAKQEMMTQHMLCTSAGHVWWVGILALLWCAVAMTVGIIAILVDMTTVQTLPVESRCQTTTTISPITSSVAYDKALDVIGDDLSDPPSAMFQTPLLLTLVLMMTFICFEALYMGPINMFIACHRCICCDPETIPYIGHSEESSGAHVT
ncbi:uncharacterized protein LOC106154420 isoform X2 [Lingula anatina]|uniref:Uncharacterized protein LOC106154420 isoform X2 n=1 Tax=Lingula anatina TaxID=7574 RepID=A0A1S3HDW4_LINAN|nr:uncharacterized protein LOC106154420 isoform X2 [Lingula anatina]|eukprot:XP_013384220.1 uncharacterized protein LOC106154420 isoform X2 [Lingula anatina]